MRQGWSREQGQGRGRKDQTRQTPGLGWKGPSGTEKGVEVGTGRMEGYRRLDRKDARGPGRDGKARAEPRLRGRKESGERRRPYLSGTGHVEGGRGRGHRSRSPRASRRPARDAQSRRVRGSTETPVRGGASSHFRRLLYALPLAGPRIPCVCHVGCGAGAWGPAWARGEPERTRSALPQLAL